MPQRSLQRSRCFARAAALCLAAVLSPAAAGAITFSVSSTASSGTATISGTITFASVGDALPTSFSFVDSSLAAEWTEADIGAPTPQYLWSGSAIQDMQYGQLIDLVAPGLSSQAIQLGQLAPDRSYVTTNATGTLTFTEVPEPAVGTLLGAVAIGTAALRRRRR